MTMQRAALAVIAAMLVPETGVSAQHWPSFRGPGASGTSESARPPVSWSLASASDVAWRTAIPGLAHSSPVVWGTRVFLTTAISTAPGRSVAVGDSDRAGIDSAPDQVTHRWRVMALDRAMGSVLWFRDVHAGVPRVKRHVKASHASATPVTDGRVVVAMLGSEGLFAFDVEGNALWHHDLGALAVGLADDPTYEWGPASSPVIHGDTLVVQNDRYRDSYLIAFDLMTGRERWRSGRDELPSWATPLIHTAGPSPVVVAVSPRFIRGHDLVTGRERWRIADPDGQVKVSTPIAAGPLAIATGGYPSGGRPILAIRAQDGSVAWRLDRGSPYTTTPLVYQGLLYVVTDNGILSTYETATGAQVYQRRLPARAGAFSASPVAAAGRVYLASEDGEVFVVRAGRSYALLATNDMEEVCMATPALTGDLLLIRTLGHVYALRGRN